MSMSFGTIPMHVHSAYGILEVGTVTKETTIGTIEQAAAQQVIERFPGSPAAESLRKGESMVRLFAYNEQQESTKTLEKIFQEHQITSQNDDFFYQCRARVLKK